MSILVNTVYRLAEKIKEYHSSCPEADEHFAPKHCPLTFWRCGGTSFPAWAFVEAGKGAFSPPNNAVDSSDTTSVLHPGTFSCAVIFSPSPGKVSEHILHRLRRELGHNQFSVSQCNCRRFAQMRTALSLQPTSYTSTTLPPQLH